LRKVKLRRPPTSWSAVVQGAVLAGIEKNNDASLTFVTSFRRSYGIVMDQLRSHILNRDQNYITSPFDGQEYAEKQLEWLFHKGDVIFNGKNRETKRESEMKASTTMRINWEGNVKEKPSGKRSIMVWTSEEETLEDRPTTTMDSEDGAYIPDMSMTTNKANRTWTSRLVGVRYFIYHGRMG
jgi:hypothetical protein